MAKTKSEARPIEQQIEETETSAATIVYPGGVARASIELRVLPNGSNEAYLVPSGAAPIPTGVSLIEDKGKYYVLCRIRKSASSSNPKKLFVKRYWGR
jgi:hypothetical protein